jgi:hypothetical protein
LEVYVRLLHQGRQLAACIGQAKPGSDRHMELVALHRTVAMASAALAVKLD